jgi:ABC-type branched-subunit amino acid transport system ATPase component
LGNLVVRLARDWGLAVLLIEHDVGMVLRTCDRVEALNFGQSLASGTPTEIAANQDVIDAYLGTAHADAHRAAASAEESS